MVASDRDERDRYDHTQGTPQGDRAFKFVDSVESRNEKGLKTQISFQKLRQDQNTVFTLPISVAADDELHGGQHSRMYAS